MTPAAASHPEFADRDTALSTAIARLATPHATLSAERQSLPDTPRGRLSALLQEIHETVLPRRITLLQDDTPLAHLTVTNRRLFRVAAAQTPAPDADAQDLQATASALLDLSKQVKSMSTQAVHGGSTNTEGAMGASVEKLRAALGLDDEKNEISHLQGLLAPAALAQMSWTDGPAAYAFSGADTWRDLLETHAARITHHIATDTVKKLSATPVTKGMALPLSQDTLLVVACKDRAGVATITPRTEGLKAISTWQITSRDTL